MYMDEFRDGESIVGTGKNPKPQRTVYVLYIPGGGLFAALAATSTKILEDLTEEDISTLFQIKSGVSGGSINVGGTSIPSPENPVRQKISGATSERYFMEQVSRFFPTIPRRMAKLFGTQLVHTSSDALDPLENERLQIEGINRACGRIRSRHEFLVNPSIAPHIKTIEALGNIQWLSKHDKQAVLKACEQIALSNEGCREDAEKIARLIHARSSERSLKRFFMRTAYAGLEKIKASQVEKEYFYPAQIAQDFYREAFGETRLSESLGSLYITVNDEEKKRPVTYYSRREDLFDLSPDAKRVVSPTDPKIWDLVMGSTANPFAYPNHTMEDGTICSDIATIHTPFKAIADAVTYKPADANVKLVILGTGRVLDHDKHKQDIIDYNSTRGVVGNLFKNKQMGMLHTGSMALFYEGAETLIGEGNIIEINPCLSSEDYEKALSLPSHDMTDGSAENMKKIQDFCDRFPERHMHQFLPLAFELVQNLYHLGRMTEEKYSRVTRKLGYEPVLIPKEPEPVAEEAPAETNIIQFVIPELPSEPELPAVLEKPKGGRLSWLWTRLGWAEAPSPAASASNDPGRPARVKQYAP